MTNFKFFQGNIYAEVDNDVAQELIDLEETVYFEATYPNNYMREVELAAHWFDEPLYVLLGGEQELTADYGEAVARNNEQRSFECWLEDKIQ